MTAYLPLPPKVNFSLKPPKKHYILCYNVASECFPFMVPFLRIGQWNQTATLSQPAEKQGTSRKQTEWFAVVNGNWEVKTLQMTSGCQIALGNFSFIASASKTLRLYQLQRHLARNFIASALCRKGSKMWCSNDSATQPLIYLLYSDSFSLGQGGI